MASALRSQIASTFAAGVTAPAAPRPRWLRRGPIDFVFLADLATALICFGITNNLIRGYSTGTALLIALVLCAPLVLRNRLPLTAWTTSAVGVVWSSLAIQPHTVSKAPYIPTAVLVYGLCLYAVAVRCKVWVVVIAAVVTVIGAVVVDVPTTAGAALLSAIPLFAGIFVRSRHSNREQLEVAERRHEGERAV